MPSVHNFVSPSTSGRMPGSSETREYASVQQWCSVQSNLRSTGLDQIDGNDCVFAEGFQPGSEDNSQRQQAPNNSDVCVDHAPQASTTPLVDPKVARRRRLGAERSRRYYQRKVGVLGRHRTRRKDGLHHAEMVFRVDTAGRSEGCKKKQALVRNIWSPWVLDEAASRRGGLVARAPLHR